MKMVQWGIIGPGSIAANFAQAWQSVIMERFAP